MRALATRRVIGVGITASLAVGLVVVHAVATIALLPAQRYTGELLFALMLILALLNLRKKLPVLPIGSASTWLQVHIYLGLLSIVVYSLHTGGRVPDGALERTVALLYTGVVASGLAGLFLSRWLPARLARRSEEVLFERIPALRLQLREQAEALVMESANRSESSTLADLYTRRLLPFFDGARNFWLHLVESNRPGHRTLGAITALNRYLNEDERQVADQLADLVRAKNDLDYQYAGQAVLKYWLFVHIPLTYALLIFASLHGALVYAFSGGFS